MQSRFLSVQIIMIPLKFNLAKYGCSVSLRETSLMPRPHPPTERVWRLEFPNFIGGLKFLTKINLLMKNELQSVGVDFARMCQFCVYYSVHTRTE